MKVKSQLIDAQLEQRATNPTKKSEVVYHTGEDRVKTHNGSEAKTVAWTSDTDALDDRLTTAESDIDSLETDLNDHVEEATDAHQATAIGFTGTIFSGLSSANVRDAIEEIESELGGVSSTLENKADASDLEDHELSSTSVHGIANTADLATLSGAQVLTGQKTFDVQQVLKELAAKPTAPAAGYKQFYVKNDGKLYTQDSLGIEIEVGAGGGSGGINYIDNFDFEKTASGEIPEGWAQYNDGAVAAPVDGTGGTASMVTTVSVGSGYVLRKDASFALQWGSAASKQGQGVSYDFTVDPADADGSKRLWVQFDYKTNSTFVSGDMTVHVYDVTNGTYLGPVSNDADGAILPSQKATKYVGSFYTVDGATQYRLIFHAATSTSAQPWVSIDDVKVGPQGTVQSEYTQVEYVYNSSGITAPATEDTTSFATGEEGAAIGSIDSATTTGLSSTRMTVQFSDDILPDDIISLQIKRSDSDYWVPVSDNAPAQTYAAQNQSAYGMGTERVSSANNRISVIFGNAGRTTAGATYGAAGAAWSALSTSRWRVARYRKKSAVLSTTEVNLRRASARYTVTSTFASPTTMTIINYATKDYDTHNIVATGASWRWTAVVPGFHKVNAWLTADLVDGDTHEIRIYKNGTGGAYNAINPGKSGFSTNRVSDRIWLDKGDYVDVRHNTSTSRTAYNGGLSGVVIEFDEDQTYFGVYGEKEVVEATVTPAVSFPASGVYGDATSIELTPGEWEIRLFTYVQTLSTNTNVVAVGIGTASGNDSTGVDNARNRLRWATTSTALDLDLSGSLIWRTTITSTTTYYVKMLATYSSGTPICQVNVSARRIS